VIAMSKKKKKRFLQFSKSKILVVQDE